MKVTSLELSNFRSFERLEPTEFSQINVLVGPNNSGKTSILRALHLLQKGGYNVFPEVRVNSSSATVIIKISENTKSNFLGVGGYGQGAVTININSGNRSSGTISFQYLSDVVGALKVEPIENLDPHHFIVPYLSRRKASYYQEDVKQEHALRVNTDMQYLAAKLSRLANPGFPEYERYSNTCKAILGFVVTAIPSTNGQRPGVYLPDRQTIPIDQMGEGVPNVVALLADLALSKGKLFLIEEPENDLHPQALKALLDLIIESAQWNQFVISTHSNIVVRYLASLENSKLFSVTSEAGRLPPVASIREVEPTVEARLEVLRDLGYSFSDFDLWDGWLILEESSAERIIRDYLIPWFAPKLSRIRTIATGGVDEVEPTFADYNRLVRFTHLEEAYRNSVWVRVDGDHAGSRILNKLKEKYPSWGDDGFKCFSKEQFEYYYPAEFQERAKDVLSITDKQKRRENKRILLNDVRAWLDADKERGIKALEESAIDVILELRDIEKKLFARSKGSASHQFSTNNRGQTTFSRPA